MANQIYAAGRVTSVNGQVILGQAVSKVMLVDSTYVFSHTHIHTGSVYGEISSAGYTVGGLKIQNSAVYLDYPDRAFWSGSPLTWSGITATPAAAIIYTSGTVYSDSFLFAYIDFGIPQPVVSADFTITWNDDGIFSFQ